MPHRHPLALLLLVGSSLILLNFAVDVGTGSFPNQVWLRGLRQAITGA